MAQRTPQFNLRLDPDLKAWVDAKAKELRLSRTWIVNHAIKEAMRRDPVSTR